MRAAFYSVFIGALALVSGCTFIDGPSYEEAKPQPQQGEALIVVYRRASVIGDGVRSTLWMDGALIGKLPIESFITLHVDPGTYHLIAGPKAQETFPSAVVTVEAGRIYYLRFRRGVGVDRLREVTPAKALGELEGMTHIAHPEDA